MAALLTSIVIHHNIILLFLLGVCGETDLYSWSIYIGGGFIGEKTLDLSNSDKHMFSYIGEKTFECSKTQGLYQQ